MDSVGRLLLRLMLVPLGYMVAAMAGAVVILSQVPGITFEGATTIAFFSFVFAAPVVMALMLTILWMPGAIGILISEALAIRSWMFHAGNGAVSAWIGWKLLGDASAPRIPNEPMAVFAAGLAAGFAYWLVAGWSAGFWKPVFRGVEPLPRTRAALPSQSPEIR